ncbi:hypothetical protein I4F81_000280 [Pyropia yezoensis]|uniref:Uncharacterized protein n=1 Tax=Pyropia yezoensis TaxID=2788 RepID=A0ACC3BIR0_PYRYE|nr:hypothetical protein I4F81_000280 [Neopyropia yezoensis]
MDDDGGPLLGAALGAFDAATTSLEDVDGNTLQGDDCDSHSAGEQLRLNGARDDKEGCGSDQDWDASMAGPSCGDCPGREGVLVSSLPLVTVPDGVHVPMGGVPLRASDDLLWPPTVEAANEEEMGSDASGAGGFLDGANQEALYVPPPTSVAVVFWPRIWADEVWARGGLWAALARVRAMVSSAATVGAYDLPAAVSILQSAVEDAARPSCVVGDVPSFAVAPILHLTNVLDDAPTAMAVLRRLVLPSPPGIADSSDDPPRAPRGLRSFDEAAAVADLARWWGCNARREELAVLRRVVSESGPPSMEAVRWLAGESSRERFQAFLDGAVGSSAAEVTVAAQIHCATAARMDVSTAVAAVNATFLPSDLVTDMAELFCFVMNGNVSAGPPHASLALAALGRLAVSGLVNVSPAMVPKVTRLFSNSMSLGDNDTHLILHEKLSCRQEAVSLHMLVAVLSDPGVLAAGTHRWQSSGRDEATSVIRPVAATFVKRAAPMARHPLPTCCIPAALPPREATALQITGAGATSFLRGPSLKHTVGPVAGGVDSTKAWVDFLLFGAAAAIRGYDINAVPVTRTDGVCVMVTKSRRKTFERAATYHNASVAAVSHLQSLLRVGACGRFGTAGPSVDTPCSNACFSGLGTKTESAPSPASSCFSHVKRATRSTTSVTPSDGTSNNDNNCTSPKTAAVGKSLEPSPRPSKHSRNR